MTREERGKKAAYFRTEAGLTRKELGSRLHLTEQEVLEYEAGTGGIPKNVAAAEESPGDNNPGHTVLYSVFEGCGDIAANMPARIACEYYRAYQAAPEHVRRIALSFLLGRLTDIRFRGQAGFWDIYFN